MLAVIGGTSLSQITGFELSRTIKVDTPFGCPSSELMLGTLAGEDIVFLARHGQSHSIAPHKINYRANIWALKEVGVKQIIASAAVGGIREDMAPGVLLVPDQIIDYTYGREHSFFGESFDVEKHIDFTYPYTQSLRSRLITVMRRHSVNLVENGVYGVTQGPRLETAAEINRMAKDGCTVVGMTAMPEAALARELDLEYASCALVVNWAAGITGTIISMAEIKQVLASGQQQINRIVTEITLL
jgi:5'-deoxy-5'-methylthioadenosine phosphorylase